MRIIAGRLRSRRLHAPAGDGTRPTNDRVREALFSILGDIRGARVADLFAGTGALGIEALSRGAHHACFVERAREALDCLRRNLRELELESSGTVIARSVQAAANELLKCGPYDLVFCDPPWKTLAEVGVTLNHLAIARCLTEDGLLVLEHPAKFDVAVMRLNGLVVQDTRHWGDTGVTLLATQSVDASQTGSEERRDTGPFDSSA